MIAILSILVVCFLQIQGLIAIKPYDTHQDLLIGTVMHVLICVAQRILVASYDAANLQTIHYIMQKNPQLKELTLDLQKAYAHQDKFWRW